MSTRAGEMNGAYATNTSAPPTTRTTPDSGIANADDGNRHKTGPPAGYPYNHNPQQHMQFQGPPIQIRPQYAMDQNAMKHGMVQHGGSFDETSGAPMPQPFYGGHNVAPFHMGQPPIYDPPHYAMPIQQQFATQPQWARSQPPMQGYHEYDVASGGQPSAGPPQMRGPPQQQLARPMNQQQIGAGPHQYAQHGMTMQGIAPQGQQQPPHMQQGQMFYGPPGGVAMPPQMTMVSMMAPPPVAPSSAHQPMFQGANSSMIMVSTGGQHYAPQEHAPPHIINQRLSRNFQNQGMSQVQPDPNYDMRAMGQMGQQMLVQGVPPPPAATPVPLMAATIGPYHYDSRFSAQTPSFIPSSMPYAQGNYPQQSGRYPRNETNGRPYQPRRQPPKDGENDTRPSSAVPTPHRSQTQTPSSCHESGAETRKEPDGKSATDSKDLNPGQALKEAVAARLREGDSTNASIDLPEELKHFDNTLESMNTSDNGLSLPQKMNDLQIGTKDSPNMSIETTMQQQNLSETKMSSDVRVLQPNNYGLENVEQDGNIDEPSCKMDKEAVENLKRTSDSYCSYCLEKGYPDATRHRIRENNNVLCPKFQNTYFCKHCGEPGHVEPTCRKHFPQENNRDRDQVFRRPLNRGGPPKSASRGGYSFSYRGRGPSHGGNVAPFHSQSRGGKSYHRGGPFSHDNTNFDRRGSTRGYGGRDGDRYQSRPHQNHDQYYSHSQQQSQHSRQPHRDEGYHEAKRE
ncbi:unnamed protein product, partial [Mesorhabditis belari]|uniref:CCHC-type domain-containing protein n=1 Tax=Mesorhabditis belari TaxID=2138241 RepID=A0AAF3EFB8_9BILA